MCDCSVYWPGYHLDLNMGKFKMLVFFCLLFSIASAQKTITIKGSKPDEQLPLVAKPGVDAMKALQVNYQREGMRTMTINFKEPVVVGVASKPEKWGFFQFGRLGLLPNGAIQAKWNMNRDAIEAYGSHAFGTAISVDLGKNWKLTQSVQETGLVKLPNGDLLDIVTPKPIKVEELRLPNAVGFGADNYRKSPTTYYRLHELPESRQGVFLKRLKKGESNWEEEKAKLYDPDAARYSLSGLFPVVWWGDIRIAKDQSLIAGVYPGILVKNGVADPKTGVFFYRSADNGKTWHIQGRIPFAIDTISDPKSKLRMGFTEPAFEILSDGTYLCVMRTSDGAGNGPMFASYSKDLGKTWTNPKSIAGNGVLPNLLQLENGVLVMSSGRPGVQLRFATKQKDLMWTDAFEMLPYQDDSIVKEQNGNTAVVSDGYTSLLPIGKNKFLIIYTDFAYKTAAGEVRKAVKVREVVVN